MHREGFVNILVKMIVFEVVRNNNLDLKQDCITRMSPHACRCVCGTETEIPEEREAERDTSFS